VPHLARLLVGADHRRLLPTAFWLGAALMLVVDEALEERDARSLGVPVAALRRGVLVCCAVLVAAQVAVSGSIAWMGLVVPHLARLLVGADHRRLLPTAFWLGAALMLVVD
ncbi:hypothetical protein C5706_31790, partial [Klebsiella pneumoniae]